MTYSYREQINPEDLKELFEFNPGEDLENKIFIEQILNHLSPKHKIILEMIYGLNKDEKIYSLEEIGKYFKLSSVRIGQIQKDALTEFRKLDIKLARKDKLELYIKRDKNG